MADDAMGDERESKKSKADEPEVQAMIRGTEKDAPEIISRVEQRLPGRGYLEGQDSTRSVETHTNFKKGDTVVDLEGTAMAKEDFNRDLGIEKIWGILQIILAEIKQNKKGRDQKLDKIRELLEGKEQSNRAASFPNGSRDV